MKTAAIKLVVALSGMPLSVLFLRWTHHDLFFLLFLISFLMSVLYWLDIAHLLRNAPNRSRLLSVVATLFGVPQALLGLATLAIGLCIVGWVFYNTFVKRLPEYTGGFLTFGIGPLLVIVGAAWLSSAFRREADHET